MTDALGRLSAVYEDPTGLNYLTSYTYDVLGSLRKVEQGGQLRFFMYDSLGRLIRAKNPEQGVITNPSNVAALTDPVTGNSGWSMAYSYDANGNLATRTDARLVSTGVHVTATYEYDNINRLKQTTYNNGTPYTLRTYDFATNGRGRYFADYESSTSGTVNYVTAYDALGRPTAGQSEFYLNGTGWRPAYTTSRTYDKMGHVTVQTYPSGHTVNYDQFDVAGRLKNFTGNLGDGVTRTYATGISYDEAGRMQEEGFGATTPLYHKLHYNVRGQLYDVRLSTVAWATDQWNWNRGALINHYSGVNGWAASGPENNGNVLVAQHWAPNNDQISSYSWMNQYYAYDALNRLTSVTEQANGATTTGAQGYGYDRFGNRQIDAAQTWGTGLPEPQFTVDAATNRLGVPAGYAGVMAYDAAGNLTYDSHSPHTLAGSRTYDAENRMTATYYPTNQFASGYTYDAAGKRVRRKILGSEVWQVYGLEGELLAEYAANAAPSTPQQEYGYRNGELLITATAPERTNVALASAGAQASASSYLADPYWGTYPPSAVIDGSRRGPSSGTLWLDTTFNTFPDWVEVTFAGQQTISEIDLFTQRDDPQAAGEPSAIETFTQYGVTAVTVQYWDGTAWQSVPGGSVTGNNLVWRKFSFAPLTTTKLRVVVNAGIDSAYSRLVEVEAWTAVASPVARPNLAAAANGATVLASTTMAPYVASYLTDGDRKGVNFGVWLDNTFAAFPDWVEVNFGATKTVGEISIYTRQDDAQNPVEPTEAQTFTLYGATGYEVQYWTGSAWQTVPGGTVTGNDKVWRKFTFTPVTTQKLRVVVNAGIDNAYSRLVEVEAYEPQQQQQGAQGEVNWLVTDHLGTPRMVVGQTGSLSGIRRHDYLPFGEELGAGTGGRTTAQGYAGDNVRQQFTSKERDDETGLDYFNARYYSSTIGRFTSTDEPFMDQEEEDPQSWNLYAYVRNNPLLYTDPHGLWRRVHNKDGEYWEADKAGDTLDGLAKLLGVSTKSLVTFFGSDKVGLGQIFDIGNYTNHHMQGLFNSRTQWVDGMPMALGHERQRFSPQRSPTWTAPPPPNPVSNARDFLNSPAGQVGMAILPIPGGPILNALKGLGLTYRAGKGGKAVYEVVGHSDEALMLFNKLRGTNAVKMKAPGVWVADSITGAGKVTFRYSSKSGPPTVSVHGIQAGVDKLKFVPK